MPWIELIARLTSSGLTQTKIAETCDVSQSTISDLARGATKSPTYALGEKLKRMAESLPAAEAQPAEPATQGQVS